MSWSPPWQRRSAPRASPSEERITSRLPLVDLTDLLIEVDQWTGFSQHLQHSMVANRAGTTPAGPLCRAPGPGLQPRLRPDGPDGRDPRRPAGLVHHLVRPRGDADGGDRALVNFQHRQPLSRRWGGGRSPPRMASGSRSPARCARPRPCPATSAKGVTFYTWTSDQFSQYGTKVIPATVRDATYVLDAILDNETELPILEHTTDTAGYTEIVFALFDLLGLQFSPRIRDLGDQRLYRLTGTSGTPTWPPASRDDPATSSCATGMTCCGWPGR